MRSGRRVSTRGSLISSTRSSVPSSAWLLTMIGTASAVFSALGGVYVSFFIDGSTAACIVLVQSSIFLLTLVFAPKHGLLSRPRTFAPA